MPDRHNGYDAHRVLRARLCGARKPKRNWIGGMFPDLAVPPVAMIVPEKEKPPAREAEG